MKILVIGGNGFIGRELLDKLTLDTNFHIVNIYRRACENLNPNVDNYMVNRRDIPQLKRLLAGKKYDVIVDLCAFGAKDILSIIDTIAAKKYIFLSSSAVYDFSKGELVESSELTSNSKHAYGENKLKAERALSSFSGIKIIIRPAVVYGKGDSNRYRAKFFFDEIMQKERLVLPGNARYKNNYIHVADLVNLITKSIVLEENIRLNAGGKIFDWYEYIAIISNILGKDTIIQNKNWTLEQFREIAKNNHFNFPHNVFHDFIVINSQATKLGWFPSTELIDGLTNTWNWLKE